MNNKSFSFRGLNYVEGERVRVSGHYAGYKQQYDSLEGTVYLGANNTPMVKIEINPNDINQINTIQLECWEKIEKIMI